MSRPRQSSESLLVILLLVGVFFNVSWIVFFSVTILVVLLAAKYLRKRSLQQVRYLRKWHYKKGFPGEKTTFSLVVKNHKKLPLTWLKTEDPWPACIEIEQNEQVSRSRTSGWDRFVNAYSLPGKSIITRNYNMTFLQRGVYPVGPVRLESGDPFGFYQTSIEENYQEYLTVYPRILPELNFDIPAEDPTGSRYAFHSLFQDINQPIGVRPYQREDSFRDIHWPTTARSGNLQSKLYQPILSKEMVIILNVSTTAKPWLGTSHRLVEYLIQVAATLAYQNYHKGYSIGVVSNGCLAHSDHPFMIMPGRSREHLSLILESLAAVTPYVTAPFEEYLYHSIPRIPYGATIVIVTGLVSPLLMETIIQLRSHRNQLALISLDGEEPPHIPGVFTYHIRQEEEESISDA